MPLVALAHLEDRGSLPELPISLECLAAAYAVCTGIVKELQVKFITMVIPVTTS